MTIPGIPDDRHELVVDARHQDVVAAALRDLGVWHEDHSTVDTEVAESLDLVLFGGFLDTLRATRVKTRRTFVNEIAELQAVAGRRFDDLDLLLFVLRRKIAAETGFVPEMGKNRTAAMVYPQADGDPRKVDNILRKIGAESKGDIVSPVAVEGRGPVGVPGGLGHGITVGMVDTPTDVVVGDEPLSPWAGHGNFVRGCVHAQAPGATVVAVGGLDSETGTATSWTVAKKIAHFIAEPVDILNLSLGVTTEDGHPPLVLRRAIDRLPDKTLVVAAAGNRAGLAGVGAIWPAAMTDVVAVGADTEYGSHFSPRKPWVDCTADGVDVESTYVTGPVQMADGQTIEFTGKARWTGTSFAAPTVCGAVAAEMATTTHESPREAFDAVAERDGSPVRRYVHIPCD